MKIKPFYLDLNILEKVKISINLFKSLRKGSLILGENTKRFEEKFAKYIGVKYAVTMNTATSCLEVLMTLNNASGKNIGVCSNTNFASVIAIIKAGGNPVLLEMDPSTLSPSMSIIREAHKQFNLQGLMWVHIGGVISREFKEIVKYCNKEDVFIVEDCAHAHGSGLDNTKAGAFTNGGGAFSFFPTKVMTTIEGGIITTNDKTKYELAKSFRNQGKRHAAYGGLHYDLGNSWRMSEISAFMGLTQLKKLNRMIKTRTEKALSVITILEKYNLPFVDFRHMSDCSNYKFVFYMPSVMAKDELIKLLAKKNIYCGGEVYSVPCHLQPVFENISKHGDLDITKDFCERQVCLPITSKDSKSEVKYLIKHLEQSLSRILELENE